MLHIVKSLDKLNLALEYRQERDDILLIEDAVYAGVVSHSMAKTLADSENLIFLLKEDVQARGLEGLIATSYSLVSYSGFVELTVEHDKSVTW